MTTLRALLFGEVLPGQAGELASQAEEAARRLVEAGAVPAGPGAHAIARALVRKVGELLDIEISDVLVGAWRTGSSLLDAARRTRAEPGTSRQVTVRTYTFGWDCENDVDVTLNRSTIAGLVFLGTAQAEVTGLAVTVHDGHISAVHGGDLDLSAEVRFEITAGRTGVGLGDLLLARGCRTFDLRYEVGLPAGGISLL